MNCLLGGFVQLILENNGGYMRGAGRIIAASFVSEACGFDRIVIERFV